MPRAGTVARQADDSDAISSPGYLPSGGLPGNSLRIHHYSEAFLRGGRLSGFLDAKRTPFYFTKKLQDVSHMDEEGRSVRVPQ